MSRIDLLSLVRRASPILGKTRLLATLVMLTGCAGMQRSCAVYDAENYGSDWIVVQLRADGTPFDCWKLRDASITNEDKSDGIYWVDSTTGHLIHISGWYNRVQVVGNSWDAAAKYVGVDLDKCVAGRYPAGANG